MTKPDWHGLAASLNLPPNTKHRELINRVVRRGRLGDATMTAIAGIETSPKPNDRKVAAAMGAALASLRDLRLAIAAQTLASYGITLASAPECDPSDQVTDAVTATLVGQSETVPPGFTVIGRMSRHPKCGFGGLVVRAERTGVVKLLSAGAMRSLPPNWQDHLED